MSIEIIQIALLLTILGMAIVMDIRWRRIPNWLTGPAILLGIGMQTFMNHLDGFLFSLEGMAIGLGLLLILYVLGWIGAGDVKLYAAVGSFLGPFQTISAAFLIAFAGGLMAILVLGFHQGWKRTGGWLWSLFQTLFLSRSMKALAPANNVPTLPYAVAICVGTIGSYWWSPLG